MVEGHVPPQLLDWNKLHDKVLKVSVHVDKGVGGKDRSLKMVFGTDVITGDKYLLYEVMMISPSKT